MTRIAAAVLLAMTMTSQAARASEPVRLFSAGSLRAALTDAIDAFTAATAIKMQAKYGPTGLLREEIVGGAKVDVFASANMAHPQALAQAGRSGSVALFARNRLCALVRPGLAVTSATLLDRMLDPAVKLGTSTPRADPSGDYTWEVFRKADTINPGARAILEGKARQRHGGPSSAVPAGDRAPYGILVAEGAADIFLTYCTGVVVAQRENPGQQVVALPDPLAVGADYGMTVIAQAPPEAYRFALFIMSTEGQRILARHGFAAPGLPQTAER